MFSGPSQDSIRFRIRLVRLRPKSVRLGVNGRVDCHGFLDQKIQVLMIRLPAGRLFTFPLPPVFRAALPFAAVILPPLLFLAMLWPPFLLSLIEQQRGTEKR
jgi:hypothetical protein